MGVGDMEAVSLAVFGDILAWDMREYQLLFRFLALFLPLDLNATCQQQEVSSLTHQLLVKHPEPAYRSCKRLHDRNRPTRHPAVGPAAALSRIR
jgi:hypothetical protein